ncbi:hypothetical protein MMC19_003092 [Ptychographa xylographoides]|nr:hypothetical protein [Ptychographa xylographoides]
MADVTALTALIVAVVALLLTGVQLTQQLMATAYVLRKCDRIVTGGVIRGGTRQWHWRQFRFTVRYQGIVFTLPERLLSALGVPSTIKIDAPLKELWSHALKQRPMRSISVQSCWISFIEDMIMSSCIRPADIGIMEESGDRIPDDLTVAPARVDTITIMLVGVALGLQVSKYSPTTGEISMAGGAGAVTSSIHPILGGLLHYSVFANEPSIGFEAARRHGHALLQEEGVWANAVFGRFRDRSYRPVFESFKNLHERKFAVVQATDWPKGAYTDTIGGAACFLAFAHVDAYEAVPPSPVRPWCAHFAEVIVKSHLLHMARTKPETTAAVYSTADFQQRLQKWVDKVGSSSPHMAWEGWDTQTMPLTKEVLDGLDIPLGQVNQHDFLMLTVSQGLVLSAHDYAELYHEEDEQDKRDPSTYIPMAAAWEAILRADQCLRRLSFEYGKWPDRTFERVAEQILAAAIRRLADVGPPSWGRASTMIRDWPEIFSQVSQELLESQNILIHHKAVSMYAYLSGLRAAYYTIMMRAAGNVGPGITDKTSPGTALAYMA